MAPWKLPLLVAAIAVPIAAGFVLAGPAIGVSVGALVAVAVVVVTVRQRPRGAIGADAPPGRRLLVVVARPVEDPQTVTAIDALAGAEDDHPAAESVLVLAPARTGFLDRWASDLEGARRVAQENLVVTVASLAKAGIEAEARVGDEDLVQAIEDQIGSYPATEVVLVTADAEEDPGAERAVGELRQRLRVPLDWLVV
ncbi:MAG: hypothetical protein JST31_06385 [Actinobacteria bacterium]|nr:hypothetical protein [Actinomycetota bacterium]